MRLHCLVFTIAVLLIIDCMPVAAEPSTDSTTLQVGIAAHDITPPIGYPMSGYYYARAQQSTVIGEFAFPR